MVWNWWGKARGTTGSYYQPGFYDLSEKSHLTNFGLVLSGHLGLALGRSWDILGLFWAALRLSWVVSGYLAAVIQVFGPTKKE